MKDGQIKPARIIEDQIIEVLKLMNRPVGVAGVLLEAHPINRNSSGRL